MPVPEWYFLFFYQLLKYMSGPLEPLATWILPIVFVIDLLLLPILDRNQDRRVQSRPVAMLVGAFFLVIMFALLGISIRDLRAVPKLDQSVARGKSLFTRSHCMACHSLQGEGRKMGPDLSYVGTRRLDREWHIRHLTAPASVSLGSIMHAKKHGMRSTFLLISVVSCSAIVHAQSLGSESTRHATSSGASGLARAPESSWEMWLTHEVRDFTPESYVPPRSPNLGGAMAPLSPSIGPGSGLIGPEGGNSPSELRSNRETDFSEAAADRSGR